MLKNWCALEQITSFVHGRGQKTLNAGSKQENAGQQQSNVCSSNLSQREHFGMCKNTMLKLFLILNIKFKIGAVLHMPALNRMQAFKCILKQKLVVSKLISRVNNILCRCTASECNCKYWCPINQTAEFLVEHKKPLKFPLPSNTPVGSPGAPSTFARWSSAPEPGEGRGGAGGTRQVCRTAIFLARRVRAPGPGRSGGRAVGRAGGRGYPCVRRPPCDLFVIYFYIHPYTHQPRTQPPPHSLGHKKTE